MSHNHEPALITDVSCHIGENPLWHSSERCLYWLDIPRGLIYRYAPATAKSEIVYQGPVTGGFTLQADGSLLLFGVQGAIRCLRAGVISTIHTSLPGEEHTRFNDVIADPLGRVIAGTMPYQRTGTGSVYRLDQDGAVIKLLAGVQLSNGMGFSPDHTRFYHADSLARTLTCFDYDLDAGTLANPHVFARLDPDEGLPDGLTVDAEGYVWLAVWDGSQIIRYAPNGDIERRIPMPTRKVSSLTFGGDDAADLYVTTAGGDNPAENGAAAGRLYRLRPEISGIPEFQSRILI